MSERPRKAASPSAPVEDPPREPVVEEVTEETSGDSGSRKSSRGRKGRTHGKSGGKKTVEVGTDAEPASPDSGSPDQAWDEYEQVTATEDILRSRAKAIHTSIADAWGSGGFDQRAVQIEVERFNGVLPSGGSPLVMQLNEAYKAFSNSPTIENVQAYARLVENFAAEVEVIETTGRDLLEAIDRAKRAAEPQEAGTAREERARLRKTVYEMRSLQSRQLEKETVQQEYFDALKERFKKQGGLETLANQVIDTSSGGPKELKKLRSDWIYSRA
ncbi:MAG: hypothetical protein Q8O19_00890, partial [Rectinemataceae bacterium]|nr:hypothetical protein [Rectinemataceae bacterium]